MGISKMDNKTILTISWLFLAAGLASMLGIMTGWLQQPRGGLWLAAAFASVGAGIISYVAWIRRRNALLRQFGVLVQAEYQRVEIDERLEINGVNPFRIIAQWHDKKSNAVFVFKSASLWFDPTQFLQSTNIPVYLDPVRPSRYFVDLSFLPKLGN